MASSSESKALAAQAKEFGLHGHTTNRVADYQPGQRNPRIAARHTSRICARSHRNVKLLHSRYGRRALRGLLAVTVDEVLVSHRMLNGDAAPSTLTRFVRLCALVSLR